MAEEGMDEEKLELLLNELMRKEKRDELWRKELRREFEVGVAIARKQEKETLIRVDGIS